MGASQRHLKPTRSRNIAHNRRTIRILAPRPRPSLPPSPIRLRTSSGLAAVRLSQATRNDRRDQAALLGRRIGAERLRAAVKKRTAATGHPLTHALAGVPQRPRGRDDELRLPLYEQAVGDRDGGITARPADRVEPGRPWLLKLHDSTDHDGDLRLTREDYLAVNQRRGALLGLLQAMLLTRTMLFVGYSLLDEDFHAVMSDVRRVTGELHVGTALSLINDTLFQELWSPTSKSCR
jgi:SIR2-like domain